MKLNRLHLWISLPVWATLGGLRLAEAWHGRQVTLLLLSAQAMLVSWLLLSRHPETAESGWIQKTIAWTSALLPFGLRLSRDTQAGEIVSSLGLLLMLWSLGALGTSFGVAPADRGLVRGGPYRFIRHPAYLGELGCMAGVAWSNPTSWNILLLHLLLVSFLVRIHWEEQIIAGYTSYARQVRYRLIPGVW
jgi:protein-S-isoprenylcysteine O-methyltransferase Ste14